MIGLRLPCEHGHYDDHYAPHLVQDCTTPDVCFLPHRYCRQTRVLTDAEAMQRLVDAHSDLDSSPVVMDRLGDDGADATYPVLKAVIAAVAADEEEGDDG